MATVIVSRRTKRRARRMREHARRYGKAGAIRSALQRMPPYTKCLLFQNGSRIACHAEDAARLISNEYDSITMYADEHTPAPAGQENA